MFLLQIILYYGILVISLADNFIEVFQYDNRDLTSGKEKHYCLVLGTEILLVAIKIVSLLMLLKSPLLILITG